MTPTEISNCWNKEVLLKRLAEIQEEKKMLDEMFAQEKYADYLENKRDAEIERRKIK